MGAWMQSVYISERKFLINILSLALSFHLGFVTLHSTNREADDPDGVERKLNEIRLTNQTRRQIGR